MAVSQELLAIAREAISQARALGMDEEDAFYMACGALMRHGRDIGAIEWLSKEMAAAIEVIVKSAMSSPD